MPAPPFLTALVLGKKDVLLVRQRARQVAHLLGFGPHGQACIAAGTFLIAHQALARLSRVEVCFQLDQNQLHVHARRAPRPAAETTAAAATASDLLINGAEPAGPLLRLAKPLPAETPIATADIAWLVRRIDEAGSAGWYDEVVRQNEEVLGFLHELQKARVYLNQMGENPKNPSAA